MTTPTEPNGMVYPSTPIVICAPNYEAARNAAIQYGIDLAASASYIDVVVSQEDIDLLVLAGGERTWCIAEQPDGKVVGRMRSTFGDPSRQSVTFNVLNLNTAWGKKWTKDLPPAR